MKNNSKKLYSSQWLSAKKLLENNGVVVLLTDTLYGIVASAFSKIAINKIYKIKKRNKNKPLIVLISSIIDLKKFNIKLDKEQTKFFKKIWSRKVSILLPCKNKKFTYIHRGTSEIAFRLITKKNKNLFGLINKIGPIVAPSANIEGLKPAESISEAKNYFGEKVDIYINSGIKKNKASTLIRLKKNKIFILRQGDKRLII